MVILSVFTTMPPPAAIVTPGIRVRTPESQRGEAVRPQVLSQSLKTSLNPRPHPDILPQPRSVSVSREDQGVFRGAR